jgi:hypothetical protein
MHVVQTAAEPPNHGRISLAMIGWTRKSRNALPKIVSAKSGMNGRVCAAAARRRVGASADSTREDQALKSDPQIVACGRRYAT